MFACRHDDKKPGNVFHLPGFVKIRIWRYLRRYLFFLAAASRSLLKASRCFLRLNSLGFS